MYLDYNATAPILPEVQQAVSHAMESLWANPSSPHAAGRSSAMAVDRARKQVASLVGCAPEAVTFTSGATEANNWALRGMVSDARPLVLASAVEHPSVRECATDIIPVDGEGLIDLDAFDQLLSDRVAVVSVMAANNETGVLQPVEQVAERCRAKGVPFHCDVTQIPGKLAVAVDADLMSLSAHKFGGPRGVGALVTTLNPRSLLTGGGQERGRRASTLNVPGIVGMGIAASLAGLIDPGPRDDLERACRGLGARIIGAGAPRLPNTLLALFPQPGDLIAAGLDLAGVQCSTGSACHSGAAETSAVLQAMGLEGIPVRFSLGPNTEVAPAIAALREVLGRMEDPCGLS